MVILQLFFVFVKMLEFEEEEGCKAVVKEICRVLEGTGMFVI